MAQLVKPLEWRGCLLTEERTLLVIRRVQLTPDGQDRVAHTGGFRLCDVSSFVIVNICNGDNKQKNRNRTGYARLAFSDFCPRHTVPDANELSTDVLNPCSDGAWDSLLDVFLDKTGSEWLESLVQEVVDRVSDGEL